MEPNMETNEQNNNQEKNLETGVGGKSDGDILLPERPEKFKKPESPLRTFSTDLAQAVRKDEMTVIKVALEEGRKRNEEELANSPTSKRNKIYITLGLIFILLTIIGMVVVYYIKKERTPEIVVTETKIPSLISAEKTTSIEVGNLAEGKIIDITKSTIQNVSGPENQIVHIYFTDSRTGKKRIITTEEFLTGIKSMAPFALRQTLGESFMLGIFIKDSIHHPFLILKTSNFQIAFSNMYTWEKTLFSDFYLPFNLNNIEDNFVNSWSDLLVENRNTRVLRQDDETMTLLYGFADENTLIITDSAESFKEVLKRIQSLR